MVRGRLLRIGVLLVIVASALATISLSPLRAFAACDSLEAASGVCTTGEIEDDEVILTGEVEGGETDTTGNGNGNGNGGNGSGNGGSDPVPCTLPAPRCEEWGVTTVTPTLNDIAAFRPTPNVDHMEPNGWFVVGLDANFYATGGSSVVDGTLLGFPASVRFTPIRWTWTYGDGSSATRSTRGGTWAALGIREFEPTPTSHVYEQAGTYYIDLTVGYRAEYTFNGASWRTIAGTLWLPANRLVATVGGAKTVLVERDCTASPGGPGC